METTNYEEMVMFVMIVACWAVHVAIGLIDERVQFV